MAIRKAGDPSVSKPAPAEAGPVKTSENANSVFSQFKELQADVLSAYEQGVSLPEAEKLAAKFLHAQMQASDLLMEFDLSSRMKKNGYKTLRAKSYLDIVQGAEKKPTEAQIDAQISTTPEVNQAQDAYERAEIDAEGLQRYFDIFRDAHIYFRGIAKGKFE